MGFLKTLLIVLGVYFLLRIIGKWMAPRLFRYALKKTENRFREAFEQARENGQSGYTKPDDDIGSSGVKQSPKSSKQVGEYIDFEEIE
jgi:hypothetical protein